MAVSKVTLNNDTLMDITDTTAEASDVASGEYFYTAAGVKTSGTSSGGGPVDVDEKDVNFYDYDGTRLYSYTAAEAQALSALPANPSHTGLTAQGWNWTLAEIKAQLTAMGGYVNVGQHYVTSSGDTEIDTVFDDPDYLSPCLYVGVNGTVVVDWGDETPTSTLTGTSLTTLKGISHTYASIGKYTIKLTVSSGQIKFWSNGHPGVLKYSSDSNYWNNSIYAQTITAVRTGSNALIGKSAFAYCLNLETITIPTNAFTSDCDAMFQCACKLKFVVISSGITQLLANSFNSCGSIKNVSIPSSVTSFGNSVFNVCTALENITFPSGLTEIGTSVFYNCRSIRNIIMPSGITAVPKTCCYYCSGMRELVISSNVTTIADNAFTGPFGVEILTIPASVTSIGAGGFGALYGTKEIHFKGTVPPTLTSTSISNVRSSCVIYVPTGYLSAYTSAQYYPSSSTYTYVEE